MFRIVLGGLILLDGIAFTVYTYASASPGDSYFVAWGAMIYGGYLLVRGYLQWNEDNYRGGPSD